MSARRAAAVRMLRPSTWAHALKLLNFYGYAHVEERRRLRAGVDVRISPSVSFRNADRIEIGDGAHVGERSCLWAGDTTGRIVLGDKALLGPEVYISASNYGTAGPTAIVDQPRIEEDVRIGAGAWLGARVIVLAGVTVGDGAVVGAGSVVTKSIPPGVVAAGVPARVLSPRDGFECR